MFSKLLKYDNRAIFKYWWIAALGSLIVAIAGGLCLQIVTSQEALVVYELIYALATIGLMFSIFGLFLLPLITEILILIRYYKNFFTDEGYLTFTLPVKKTTLLNSKLMMTMIFMIASTLILLLNIFVLLAIGIPEHVFAAETWNFIGDFLSGYFFSFGGFGVAYIILGILILIALTAAQMLFVFLCITIAATITQKHKILVAIAIYYGANMALSMVLEMLLLSGVYSIAELIASLGEGASMICVTFIMVGVLGAIVAAGAGLYLIHLYLLDKKLNLE